MKVRISGQVVPTQDVAIILDNGRIVSVQQSGEGLLLMSGNAHLSYDNELSNKQQVRVRVRDPDSAEVEEPPRIELKA